MVQDIANVNGVKTLVSEVKFQKITSGSLFWRNCLNRLVQQACTTSWGTAEILGSWSNAEKGKSSTWKETEVIRRVLNSNVAVIRRKKVKIYSDNKNVQSVLKVCSCKEDLQNIASEDFEISHSNDISMSVPWIPRELNKKADYLSRCRDNVQDLGFQILRRKMGPTYRRQICFIL